MLSLGGLQWKMVKSGESGGGKLPSLIRFSILVNTSSCLFLILAILAGMAWHLTMALPCTSLQAKDTEHLFRCLLAMCMSSLEKCLFTFFTHLKIGVFIVSLLSAVSLYSQLEFLMEYSDLQIFFPHSMVCLSQPRAIVRTQKWGQRFISTHEIRNRLRAVWSLIVGELQN